MQNIKLLLLLSFLSIYWQSSAQNMTISGYIEDAKSKERLIGVNVFIPGTTYGTTTNTYGFYSLTIPAEDQIMQVSFIGYKTQRDSIKYQGKNIRRDYRISENVEQLQEVVITAEELPAEQAQMSTINLAPQDIKNIPAFLGEVDIIRSLQLLPGVQSGSEGTTGFYVRGGSPDQNLILLDGVPVYNASHLFGFFSVFNADAIKNVKLTKGGFPARFGGRLSSVLEIDMKEGNMKEFHGAGSLGLIAGKLTLEGPIVKDRTSFIVSGRRTYYDLIIRPFLPADVDAGYYFGDFNAKINHIFSRKDRIYLSYYGGNDRFFNNEDYGGDDVLTSSLEWGNNTGSLRWNRLYSDKLFSNLTATFTEYEFRVGSEETFQGEESKQDYFSRIRDYGLRIDYEYIYNTHHNFRYGASYTYHIFRPGVFQFNGQQENSIVDSVFNLSDPIYSHDMYAYIEDDWNINEKWRANYGLHYSAYHVDGQFYNALQPRASVRYLLNENWSVKGSYASMTQYIHLLSNTGIGLPTDLWVSSTANVKPSNSQQLAFGTTRHFLGNSWEISGEVYYKWMDNLIEYQEGASFFTSSDWQNVVETDGLGRAYGLELLLRKNKGRTTGWVGYTLAWTNRQFENLNEGREFPYRYDRRNDISLVLNHKFSEKLDVGLTWVYGTGIAFTAPLAQYAIGGGTQNIFGNNIVTRYSDRNAFRFPSYHRLDLGINFHKKTRWGKRTWNFSIYNAYNRRNPFFLYIYENLITEEKEVRQVSLFPLIPAFSYIFKF